MFMQLLLNNTLYNSTAADAAIAALIADGYDVYGYNTTFRNLTFCLVSDGATFDLCSNVVAQATTNKGGYIICVIRALLALALTLSQE